MKKVITLFLFNLILKQASAQIVNIENSRMHSDTTGWMGGANLDMSLSKNDQNVFGTNLGAHLEYKTPDNRQMWLILGDYSFLKGGGQEFASSAFSHFRYNVKIAKGVKWEAFTQLQNNKITQIRSRFLLGTGPRFKLVKNKKLKMYVASLVMYEHETELTTPTITLNEVRSSSYFTFSWKPISTFELNSTTFFQPLVNRFSDHRIMNEIGMNVKASKHFGMNIHWNYLFDSHPAGTAPHTTYTLSAGAGYNF